LWLGSLGECLSSPSPAAKRLLVHFQVQSIWMQVLGNIFMQIVLDIFLLGRGETAPASAISVSTQPEVHGITGVCMCVCTLQQAAHKQSCVSDSDTVGPIKSN